VLRTGEPELAPEGDADRTAADPELSRRRRALASSWLIVPLRVHDRVFGTVTLAFGDSPRKFGASDLPLATELARRASVAVDNARLYRLSQVERSRAEAATRAKDEFVAVVSHELRTPLNAILGWTRLLRRGTIPAGQEIRALEVIERNALAQAQLVDDLLDVSRVMSGKIRINPAQVDLCDIVKLAVEGVRPAADAKRVRLDVDLEDCDIVFRGDGDRIQQVAWILLSNAIKYTPKDLGVVRVRLRRVDSVFELTVEDNGVGIEAEFLPHVFETFRQSETGISRGYGGLGVGLSIAKHLVERHGGVIEAHSDGRNLGVRMVVRLPISPLVSGTMGIRSVAAAKAPRRDAPATCVDGVCALVVDDDADARELLTFVLESSGVEVRAARSGAEATAELEARKFDIVISDIGMADGDGYQLIRAIRTGPPAWRDIPAIALTAYATHADRTRALTEGFNRHMVKPTEPEALVSVVLELVR
jgi:signal transduction histidine kinase/CheY-like chemotaxis protein